MLTESSLTNILVVSGISHINYRQFQYTCPTNQLIDFIRSSSILNEDSASAQTASDPIIEVHNALLDAHIPSAWRYATGPEGQMNKEQNVRELWVFWIDGQASNMDSVADKIDSLEEKKSGTFSWETIFGNTSLANPSPAVTASSKKGSSTGFIADEYQVFISATRNLIERTMIRRGALPVGSTYILSRDLNNADITEGMTPHPIPDSALETVMTCSFNLYLSSTNLIFQPVVKYLKMRPIRVEDIVEGKRVILSPSGTTATLCLPSSQIAVHEATVCLNEWARLFGIPLEKLSPDSIGSSSQQTSARQLPPLLEIRTPTNTLLYPVALLFVHTPTKASSNWVGGLSGLDACNTGLVEDLGSKIERWAWEEQTIEISGLKRENEDGEIIEMVKRVRVNEANIKPNEGDINYWNYVDLLGHLTETVLKDFITNQDPFGTPQSLSQLVNIDSPVGTVVNNIPTTKDSPKAMAKIESSFGFGKKSTLNGFSPAISNFSGPAQSGESPSRTGGLNGASGTNGASGASGASMAMALDNVTFSGLADVGAVDITEKNGVAHTLATTTPNTPHTNQLPKPGLNGSLVPGPPPPAMAQSNNGNPPYPSPPDGAVSSSLGVFETDTITSNSIYGDYISDGLDNLSMNFDTDVTEEDFNFFDAKDSEPSISTDSNLINSMDQEVQSFIGPDHNVSLATLPEKDDIMNLDLDTLLGHNDFNPVVLHSLVPSSRTELSPSFNTNNASPGNIDTPIPFMLQADHTNLNIEQSSFKVIVPEIKPEYPQSCQFISADFAPLVVVAGVDSTKYSDAGKFKFVPSKSQLRKYRGNVKTMTYRPDYVPKVEHMDKGKSVTKPNGIINGDEKRRPIVILSSDEENNNSSSSSSDESSSDDDDDDIELEQFPSRKTFAKDINSARLIFLVDTQPDKANIFANMTLSSTMDIDEPQKEGDGNISLDLDYDTPFSTVITKNLPLPSTQSDVASASSITPDMLSQTIEILCRQAVMGSYPFGGGLIETSGAGGEIVEGETTQVFVARRRVLVEGYDGAVEIPALADDASLVISNFRSVLGETFNPSYSPLEDSMVTDSTEHHDSHTGDSHLHVSATSSVNVKGPLNIQQYYDLAETNQTQSKYGKYQVKKRKPLEPSLDQLSPPDVVVGFKDNWLQASPTILRFWEKLRLEPYSIRKPIEWFTVYPQSEDIEDTVKAFFKDLGSVYETSLLGSHRPGNIEDFQNGLVPVPLMPESDDDSLLQRQLKSYMAACQKLGSTLASIKTENKHIVIYVINPFSHRTAYLDLCHCFAKLMFAFNAASMGATSITEKLRERVVLQLVPIDHVLQRGAFGGYRKFGLKEIAFSVYNRCYQFIGRHQAKLLIEDSNPHTELYAPSYILAKPVINSINFSIRGPAPPFPTLLDQENYLHVGYTWSMDYRWLLCVWTCNSGELIEQVAIDTFGQGGIRQSISLEGAFEQLWEKTLKFSKRTGYPWKIVIGKLGLMFGDEFHEWIKVVKSSENVMITCVDVDSPLRLYPSADSVRSNMQPDSAATPNTPNSTGAPTPEPSSSIINTIASASKDQLEHTTGERHALLVNHRIAFSKRRERVLVQRNSVSQLDAYDDGWILPLASGYLAEMPVQSDAPNKELSCLDPLAVEIHLLHASSSLSGTATLREIIKQYHALSYLNFSPTSNVNCIPLHFVLVERMCRVMMFF